ncbi:MAG: hypothetical protein N4A41_10380 [Crocinitomicaceae bacterium]|jgi:hypothetical protein|nr:hypothetical protein [Crocinitomicaceae bacterium]
MDTPTIIMSAVFLMVCILPFWLSYRNNRKLEKSLRQAIQNLAATSNISIQQFQILNKLIIGLDTNEQYLCYVKQNNHGETQGTLELKNFSKVELKQLKQKLNTDNPNETVTKLSLNFHPKGHGNIEEEIIFFQMDSLNSLDGEIQFAEHWLQRIQPLLNS